MLGTIDPVRSALALQILERAADAIVALDGQFRVVFANPAAERLLGLKEGRSQCEAFPACRRAMDERVTVHQEWFDERAQKWFEVEAAPSVEGGLIVRFRDVTERGRAEAAVRAERQRFSDVLDQLPAYLVLLDSDYRVPFANRFFRERFGESHGRRCYEYLFERTEPCEVCETYAVLRDNAPHRWEWTGPDGHNYDIYDFPFRDTDGSTLIMEVGLDITERRRDEAELARHREHLEELVKERTSQLEAANARLAADLDALTRMHALSTRLLETGEIEPLLQEIMEAAVAIGGAAQGTLQLLEGDSLRIAAHHGHRQPFLDFFARAEARASVCGEAMKRAQRVIVEDVESSALFAGTPSLTVLRKAGVRAVQSTPLVSRSGGLLGILTTQWPFPHVPDERDLWRIDLLARQAADVIEHTRAQAALRATEERNRRLADLLSRSDQPFGVGYPDGRLGFVNSAFERLTGYSREELQRIDWVSTLTPPEWREAERLWMDELDRTGRPVRYEKEYLRKDGTRTPVELLVHVVKDDQGRPLHYYAFITDLTARKRAEDELRRNREWLRVTLTSIGDAVLAADTTGKITFLNPVAARLTGWTLEEALGRPVEDVFRITDETGIAEAKDIVTQVLREGCVVSMDNHSALVSRDGREIPVEDSAAPIRDAAGNVAGVVVVFHDVTEKRRNQEALRHSEEKYRNLFLNMTEEVHFWELVRDDRGRIETWRLVDANPPALETWGKALAEIQGKTADEIFGPGAREHYLPVVEKITAEGRPHSLEDYFPNLDRHFRFTSVPLGNHFITTGSDITAIKKAEQALRRTAEELEKRTRELNAILSSVQDYLYIFDPDGRFVFANQKLLDLWGLSAGQAIGKTMRELDYPAAAETALLAGVQHVLETGLVVTNETRFKSPAGVETFFENILAPMRGPDGRVAFVAGSSRDVTGRKSSEADLQRLAEQRQIALDAARMGWWHYDPITRISAWDDRYREIFGVTGSQCPIEEILRRLHPDDLPGVWAKVEAALDPADPQPYSAEYRINLPDGSQKWVEAHGIASFEGAGENRRATDFVGTVADITERKRAEEALRQSEGRFRALAEALPQIVWTAGADGAVEWFNQRWYDYTGEPLGLGEGWSWGDSVHPDDVAHTLENWRTARENGSLYQNEKRVRRHDGQYRWFLVRAWPLRDAEGRVVRWFGTNTDIHDMKANEAALRQSREDLDRAQAVGQIGSWRLDVARNVLAWSDENYRIFGVPKGTPLTYETFLGTIHPDDRLHVDTQWKAALRGEPYDLEHRIVADGQVKWVREKAYLEIDDAGRLLGGFGISQDITARKRYDEELRESEERLKRAQEIAHLGSWELDLEHNRLTWSDEVYRIFGLEPQEFGATYEAFLEAVHPEDRAAVDAAYSGSLRDNRDAYEIEHRVVRKRTGEIRYVHERCEHARDSAGRIVRSVGMVHDVTERKRAEERLRHAQKLESVGVLAGGIAHDFNNLLTSILGNASLLEMDQAGNGEQLRAIVEAGEKAAGLTQQLLAYAGKGQFQIGDFDVSRLVRSSADLLRVSIPRNIDVQLDVPRNLPAVRGDSSQIQQVMMNLVINAAEAIEGRSDGRVSIGAGVRDLDEAAAAGLDPAIAAGSYISIVVRDNGCGMDEQTKAKIFDPFFTTKFTGRGLGLAAVHGILRSHKGAISVESAPGQGSTFTVYLPSSGPRAGAARRKDGARASRAATVLVVDDEDSVRAFTKAALERQGHKVLLAENGLKALEVCGCADVEIVLLDVIMPVVGGVEAFHEMRTRWPKVAILVTSGYSRQEARRLGMPPGLPFIQKPYTVQTLAAAIERCLKARGVDGE